MLPLEDSHTSFLVSFRGHHQDPELSQHRNGLRGSQAQLINHHFISAISSAAIGIFIPNQLLKMASFKGA